MRDSHNRNDGLMERVDAFKTQIQECLYYFCILYNRFLYRRSVSRFRYDSSKDLNDLLCRLTWWLIYICFICDRKLKNIISCQT